MPLSGTLTKAHIIEAVAERVCHISMREVAEGKIEQKVGYGKEKTR